VTSDLPAGSARSCSESALQVHEPLAGTAPLAQAWLVIEQHGPYGAKALLESGFPADVGRELSEPRWAGVKSILARPCGKHVGDHQPAAFRVWIAHPASGHSVTALRSDPAQLLDFDPNALVAGELPVWESAPPMLFVCTNGKRDACCAKWGRRALADVDDDGVWECSHIGGHRFAATGVLLPWGYVYGRLGSDSVRAVMASARAGRIHLPGSRGRSCFSPPAQCADLHLRAASGFDAPSDVDVSAEHRDSLGRTIVELRTPTADRVPLLVTPTTCSQPTPASCGATPEAHVNWHVSGFTPASNQVEPLGEAVQAAHTRE
jgi:hypothetical protein